MLKTIIRTGKKIPRYPHALLSRLGLGAPIYRLEIRVLLSVFNWSWVQKVFLGRRYRLIGRFLSEAGLDSRFDRKQFVRFNLAGSAVRHWWFDGFRQWDPEDLDSIAELAGWDYFESAWKKGKGVILVHHHLKIAHFAWLLLKERGYRDTATIGKLPSGSAGDHKNRSKAADSDPGAVLLNYARQFQSAKEVLSRGGIARIVPDGFRGSSSGVEYPFFNRLRVFRAGFADLALLTGAQIVPISVSMDEAGKFRVTFNPPLLPVEGADRKRQAAELVKSYVDYLEKQWADPSLKFMSVSNIRQYLNSDRLPEDSSIQRAAAV